MSAWAERAAPGARARASTTRAETEAERAPGPLWLRLLTFFAASALASIAYATLLRHPPAGRALAVAAAATAGGAALALVGSLPGGGRGARTRQALRAAALVLATLLALELGLLAVGVPAHLIAPWHWGALARAVERGVAAISWRWPYLGSSSWARLSVLMVLVPSTTLMALLCFWPTRSHLVARRFLALAVAVALAASGMANAPAGAWRVQGVLLVLLIFAWFWLPTLRAADAGRALGWTLVCALPALVAAPLLGGAHAWIPFASGEGGARTAFQWDQLYGPIGWSQSHEPMLSVRASTRPPLLRVTSLDRFDGLRFIRLDAPPATTSSDLRVDSHETSWFQRATIEVQGLDSNLLVGGDGVTLSVGSQSSGPQLPTLVRASDGTLTASAVPASGLRYRVFSYAPRPTVTQMRRADGALPPAYVPYTEFELPALAASALRAPRLAREASAPPDTARLVRAPSLDDGTDASDSARRILSSPYAPMYKLARRLAAGAATRYDVAARVERYLSSNYAYDVHPPLRRYPLEAFLFRDRRGYCEQFSGAMTLMLRMDGIPARVGVGFKPAVFDPATSSWTVRAIDAHAWVEVFFTGIGWVSFDPTPAGPSARAIASTGAASKGQLLEGLGQNAAAAGAAGARARRHGAGAAHTGGSFALTPWRGALALLAVVAAIALLATWRRARRRAPAAGYGSHERAIRELDRALAAMSWPQLPGMTLTHVARRLERGAQPEAAAYVALLRELRFGRPLALGARERSAARSQRLALRRALARGGGLRGRLRALRLMPPRAPRL